MEERTKADLINAAASGQCIVCPNCSVINRVDAEFCTNCGEKFRGNEIQKTENVMENNVPFATIDKNLMVNDHTETEAASNLSQVSQETKGTFANGLPLWTLEPPQVMVRRKS